MNEFLLVAGIHWLAVMSPGPDFAMVMRNSLLYSRRTGLLAAAGLAIGILLHVAYSLLGIGLLISKSILLFNTVKFLGAAYLIYIGVKSLVSKKDIDIHSLESDVPTVSNQQELGVVQALKLGFLTNALNPKATLFFLALFTQVISPNTSAGIKILYGVEMSMATFLWFSIVALVLTHSRVNQAFSGLKHHLERLFGIILIALGLKVALESTK